MDAIEQVDELHHLLGAVFRDQDAARQWLHAPSPALRGKTPMGEIRRGRMESVIGLLAAIESGSFD